MKLDLKKIILVVFIFTVTYSILILSLTIYVENYENIIIASTFFFSLFTGFFITRQNNRYSSVSDLIATTDGYFSYLYRVSGVIPNAQDEIREIIRDHYRKILESGDWAYHVKNPSNTLTKISEVLSKLENNDEDSPILTPHLITSTQALASLQILRKKTISILNEKLVPLHWSIVCTLGIIVIVSFILMPANSTTIQILKVLFGTSVFMSILLLIQLDQLTIFSKNAASSTASDIFHIINEKDREEIEKR